MTIQEVKQQVQQRQQQLARARQQVRESKRDFTQRELRTTTRLQRRQSISQLQKAKEKALEQIKQEEQKLKPVQEQITKVEQQIAEAEKRRRQYETAVRVYTGQITAPAEFKSIPQDIRNLAQTKAEELERGAQRVAISELKEEFERENPSEKIIIDLPKAEILGIDSGILKQSINLKEYNKLAEQVSVQDIPPQTEPPITEQVKFQEVSIPQQSVFLFPNKSTRIDLAPKLSTQTKDLLPDKVISAVGSYAVSPTLKFFSGEYGWQKELEKQQQKESIELEKKIFGRQISKFQTEEERQQQLITEAEGSPIEFLKLGQPTSAVRSLFFKGGIATIGLSEKITGQEVPKDIKTSVGIGIGSLYLGGFFSPVFETGAVKKVKKKQLLESRFEGLGDDLDEPVQYYDLWKKEGKVIRSLTQGEKVEKIRDLFKQVKVGKEQEFLKEMVRVYGESAVKDFVAQEGIMLGASTSVTPPTQTGSIIFETTAPQMRGAGLITGAISQSKFNVLGLTKEVREGVLFQSKFNVLDLQPQKLDTKTKQKLKQSLLSLQVSKLDTKTQQQTKQITEQIQQPVELTALGVLSLLKQTQKPKPKQEQPQKPEFGWGQPKPEKPKTKPPIIKLFDFQEEKQKTKTPVKDFLKSFDVYYRKKGEDVKLGKFETQEEGEMALKKFLGGTLRASGFIEREGKKVKPLSFGFKFRAGKKDPFRIVEKRSFRLDRPQEVSEIQFFKKKSKRKKKKSIGWLS